MISFSLQKKRNLSKVDMRCSSNRSPTKGRKSLPLTYTFSHPIIAQASCKSQLVLKSIWFYVLVKHLIQRNPDIFLRNCFIIEQECRIRSSPYGHPASILLQTHNLSVTDSMKQPVPISPQLQCLNLLHPFLWVRNQKCCLYAVRWCINRGNTGKMDWKHLSSSTSF